MINLLLQLLKPTLSGTAFSEKLLVKQCSKFNMEIIMYEELNDDKNSGHPNDPEGKAILAQSIKNDEIQIAQDIDGKTIDSTVVCLNEEEFSSGFTAPFTLVLGSHFDRDKFHSSIMKFIKDDGIADKSLKNKFIAWYCEMFRQPQSIFYDSKSLESSVDKVSNVLSKIGNSSETVLASDNPPLSFPFKQQESEDQKMEDLKGGPYERS